MSKSIDTIVDSEATIREAKLLSQKVVDVLCAEGIILPTPQIDELHGTGAKYATGPNAGLAADCINDCFGCGMDVVIGRNVYEPGELGFRIVCPNCNEQFENDTLDWGGPVCHWLDVGEETPITCIKCSTSSPFPMWFQPPLGLGNLAFKFTEWFLRESFVERIENLLGHRVTWVKTQY